MSYPAASSIAKRLLTPVRSFGLSSGRSSNGILPDQIQSHKNLQLASSKSGFHIKTTPKKYGLYQLMVHKDLTNRTMKNIRAVERQQQRSFSTTITPLVQENQSAFASGTAGNASKKQPKESVFSKLKRAFTFSISTVAVIGASGLAIIVIYLLIAEIAFPSGDTQTFNRAVKLVEHDEVSQKLLDFPKGERLKAFGETAGDKWTRNRPISSVRRPGLDGKEHVLMRFHVESKKKYGTVQLEAVDENFWKQEFSYVILDVPGENRHYIVKPKTPENRFKIKDQSKGFLGVKWGPKKD